MCHMFFVTVLVLLGAGLAANSVSLLFQDILMKVKVKKDGTYKAFLFTS